MINLSNLKPHPKSRKRVKIVGRGLGSGHGTYSGRGGKGQTARSGGSIKAGFEGGRAPLIRQTPKRRGKGFTGSRIVNSEIKLSDLATHFADNEKVTAEALVERGLATDIRKMKILASGDLKGRKVVVEGVMASAGAKKMIEEAGGSVADIPEKVTAPKKIRA